METSGGEVHIDTGRLFDPRPCWNSDGTPLIIPAVSDSPAQRIGDEQQVHCTRPGPPFLLAFVLCEVETGLYALNSGQPDTDSLSAGLRAASVTDGMETASSRLPRQGWMAFVPATSQWPVTLCSAALFSSWSTASDVAKFSRVSSHTRQSKGTDRRRTYASPRRNIISIDSACHDEA